MVAAETGDFLSVAVEDHLEVLLVALELGVDPLVVAAETGDFLLVAEEDHLEVLLVVL